MAGGQFLFSMSFFLLHSYDFPIYLFGVFSKKFQPPKFKKDTKSKKEIKFTSGKYCVSPPWKEIEFEVKHSDNSNS